MGEVEALLLRDDIPADAPVRRAIGVAEIAGMIEGRWTAEEATKRLATATRHYAKRQYTWFRNQPPPDWPRTAETDPTALAGLLCTAIGR